MSFYHVTIMFYVIAQEIKNSSAMLKRRFSFGRGYGWHF